MLQACFLESARNAALHIPCAADAIDGVRFCPTPGENIKSRDPRYAQLVRERARFAATTLALQDCCVLWFVLLVAFQPQVIALRLFEGST